VAAAARATGAQGAAFVNFSGRLCFGVKPNQATIAAIRAASPVIRFVHFLSSTTMQPDSGKVEAKATSTPAGLVDANEVASTVIAEAKVPLNPRSIDLIVKELKPKSHVHSDGFLLLTFPTIKAAKDSIKTPIGVRIGGGIYQVNLALLADAEM
jgi:hypothetical protein